VSVSSVSVTSVSVTSVSVSSVSMSSVSVSNVSVSSVSVTSVSVSSVRWIYSNQVAGFRDGRRFPIVCFHCHRTKAVLVRCGQPLCGYNQKKVKEDATMLNAYLPSRSRGKIIDVRSSGMASHHVGKGGGVETPAHYPQWKVEHANFDPPSALQGSLNRLMEG